MGVVMEEHQDVGVEFWRLIYNDQHVPTMYEYYLKKLAENANNEQLDQLAIIRPNLVAVEKEKRLM